MPVLMFALSFVVGSLSMTLILHGEPAERKRAILYLGGLIGFYLIRIAVLA